MSVSKIESLLFIANRPLTVKRIGELCGIEKEDVEKAISELIATYGEGRGLRLVRSGNDVQMTTAPENAEFIQEFLKDETTGELTKPSLETLTIIAYRGPITKPELEQVRGVNCSMILRNLLMRGLIEVEGDVQDLFSKYQVTVDFLRFLGLSSVEELPEYNRLNSHENIVRAIEKVSAKTETESKDEKAGEMPVSGTESSDEEAEIKDEQSGEANESEDEDHGEISEIDDDVVGESSDEKTDEADEEPGDENEEVLEEKE